MYGPHPHRISTDQDVLSELRGRSTILDNLIYLWLLAEVLSRCDTNAELQPLLWNVFSFAHRHHNLRFVLDPTNPITLCVEVWVW